ncbi:Cytochrome c oxidase subunit 6B [Clydaea vesicula]|uniref:Cytochrome c oxidase subunit n=1 Tax=Clydaea vesicula TaxID=447962 RepID=A0AAD5TZP1_9FUNG|nr:Cytochrome c oxidase subunit 6B [Clydaea vesicula]KAJ3393817.1 Cytochrome c oxidase subunit 6B [Lobulomyces angularis]
MSDEQEGRPIDRIRTVGFDARFPNTNQTKNCWQNYVDHFRCVKAKGEDYPPCHQFKLAYHALCPSKWVDKWNEQREENLFPALYEKPESDSHH